MSRSWDKNQSERKFPRSIYLSEDDWECINKVDKESCSNGINIISQYWQKHTAENNYPSVKIEKKSAKSIYLTEEIWECIDKISNGSPARGIKIILEYWQKENIVEGNL